jgi:hypothetical protein
VGDPLAIEADGLVKRIARDDRLGHGLAWIGGLARRHRPRAVLRYRLTANVRVAGRPVAANLTVQR